MAICSVATVPKWFSVISVDECMNSLVWIHVTWHHSKWSADHQLAYSKHQLFPSKNEGNGKAKITNNRKRLSEWIGIWEIISQTNGKTKLNYQQSIWSGTGIVLSRLKKKPGVILQEERTLIKSGQWQKNKETKINNSKERQTINPLKNEATIIMETIGSS